MDIRFYLKEATKIRKYLIKKKNIEIKYNKIIIKEIENILDFYKVNNIEELKNIEDFKYYDINSLIEDLNNEYNI